jgi:hypothetical protein
MGGNIGYPSNKDGVAAKHFLTGGPNSQTLARVERGMNEHKRRYQYKRALNRGPAHFVVLGK